MPLVSLKPNEEWALLISAESQLPLPSAVRWHTDIPGTLLEPNKKYNLSHGDYLVVGVRKSKSQNWGFKHTLYTADLRVDKLVQVPYGTLHKMIIKHAEGTKDIMSGAGSLAAIVREIHAIRRGVIDLGLVPKPVYPTRYQRPWVI